MSTTLSDTVTIGIVLGVGYAARPSITLTGYVNAGTNGAGGAAVYAANFGPVQTLVNHGRIQATGTVRGVLGATANGLANDNSGTISAANVAIAPQPGGVETSATVNSGGFVTIFDGATETLTISSGSALYVSDGVFTIFTTINNSIVETTFKGSSTAARRGA